MQGIFWVAENWLFHQEWLFCMEWEY